MLHLLWQAAELAQSNPGINASKEKMGPVILETLPESLGLLPGGTLDFPGMLERPGKEGGGPGGSGGVGEAEH